MNWRQTWFIFAMVVIGIAVPWFSVGMFFMGMAIGAFISIVLK